MAVTAKRDITIKIGDYYAHKINLPTVDEDGNAISWSGATFSSMIRTEASASAASATFTIDSTHATDPAPYVLLTLSAATTAALTAGTYVWDFQETRSSKPRTPVGGVARIVQDVTR